MHTKSQIVTYQLHIVSCCNIITQFAADIQLNKSKFGCCLVVTFCKISVFLVVSTKLSNILLLTLCQTHVKLKV